MTLRGLKKKKKPIAETSKKKRLTATVCKSRITAQVFDVKSHTVRGLVYRVEYKRKSDHWEWFCNCPAFIFKRIGIVGCKHTHQMEKESKICKWKSTTSEVEQKIGGVCPVCKGPTELEETDETE